jgi:hypothetical protein
MFRTGAVPVPPAGWWNRRWFLGLLVALAAMPLVWPVTPPLTDLPEHMGRYRIELSDPASPLRTTFFSFHWHFLANLGVDLLIVPLAKLFGLELGLKLLVIALPMLTVTGILWIAREVHGRVPPTALLALPMAYGFPLIWGFLNYMLAMSLALNAFALWLRLGRQGRWRLRAGLFVPIGLLLTTAHVFGWAVLCLLAFAAETVRRRDAGDRLVRAVWRGGLACLALAPPILLLLLWRSGDANGRNIGFFYWYTKYLYLVSSLRTVDLWYDLLSVYLLLAAVVCGLAGVWLRMNRTLGIATVLLIAAFLLLPRILLGSAYADMRLAPYLILVAVTALTLKSAGRGQAAAVAAVATALFVTRLGVLTVDFARRDAANQHQLAALDHVRPGSRVFVEVALPCLGNWTTSRMDHLGAMAIVRRGAFANGQWTDPGAQLVRITYRPARGYAEDPTEILRPFRCRQRGAKVYPFALNALPRDAFDYVWLIDMPRARWNSFPGLVPIWTGGTSGILYRVVPPASATRPIETPSGQRPRTAA